MEDNKIIEFCEKIINKNHCNECHAHRNNLIKDIENKDKTPTGQKKKNKKILDNYCPPYIGFWNNINQLPDIKTDVLIITESHGGGNWEKGLSFNAYERVKESHELHLFENEKDKHAKSFFQWNIKKITQELNDKRISWFITDLVKCYVYKNNPKKSGEMNNFKEAIKFCSDILKKQIEKLRPTLIVGFGGEVGNFLKSINFPRERIMYITFPSQNSADAWARNEGDYTLVVEKTLNKIEELKRKED